MLNEVTFNGLGMKFNINKIAFTIGNLSFKWYGILITLAFLFGIVYCIKERRKIDLNWEDVLNLACIIMCSSLIGARLYYVLFRLDYYSKNILKIFAVNEGGLAIYGGVLGAALSIFIYSKITKKSFLKLLDYIIPVLPFRTSYWEMGKFL